MVVKGTSILKLERDTTKDLTMTIVRGWSDLTSVAKDLAIRVIRGWNDSKASQRV